MSVLWAIAGVMFGAFWIWLTVRIVNRRERWAMWMLAMTVAMPALYVLSFGPLIWLDARGVMYSGYSDDLRIYATPMRVAHDYGPEPVRQALRRYEQTSRGL